MNETMTLKNVLVNKAEKTCDILSQCGVKKQREFKAKFKGDIYALLNANNRGYCKVLMRENEI